MSPMHVRDLFAMVDNSRFPNLKAEADFSSLNNFQRVYSNLFHDPALFDQGSYIDMKRFSKVI